MRLEVILTETAKSVSKHKVDDIVYYTLGVTGNICNGGPFIM